MYLQIVLMCQVSGPLLSDQLTLIFNESADKSPVFLPRPLQLEGRDMMHLLLLGT